MSKTFYELPPWTELFLATSILFLGLGYLAILPPFEGFDETAHYSSIRQIADTATIPVYGSSYIGKNIQQYMDAGPGPWHMNGAIYSAFFQHPEAVARYESAYRSLPANWAFAPSSIPNWEAQHPPLYYLLMAPIMKATESLSLITQVLFLRVASYLLACAGFLIGWYFVLAGKLPRDVVVGYLFLPLMMPMFVGEFARIGNDSLCLFLVGLIFSLSSGLASRSWNDPKSSVALGACFGLGLLTKAFFIPLLAGYLLFAMVRAWRSRDTTSSPLAAMRSLSLAAAVAVLIGGGWYAYNLIKYGSVIASSDSILLGHQGGLIANLEQKFTVGEYVHDMLALLRSWSWASSWSFAHVWPVWQVPLFLLTGWVFFNYVRVARAYDAICVIWLPLWLLAPLIAGLMYHEFISIALANFGVPGRYLHILDPFLALAAGYGFQRIIAGNFGRIALCAGLAYAIFFWLVVIWSQVSLFSGCAIVDHAHFYEFQNHFYCLDQAPLVFKRLSFIAWPTLATTSFVVATGSLVLALFYFFYKENKVRCSVL